MVRVKTTKNPYAQKEAAIFRKSPDWLEELPEKGHRYLNDKDKPIFDDRYVYVSQRKQETHPKLIEAEKNGMWNHEMERYYKHMPPDIFISRGGVPSCCRFCRARDRKRGQDDTKVLGCAAEANGFNMATASSEVAVLGRAKGRDTKAAKRGGKKQAWRKGVSGSVAGPVFADIPAAQEDSFMARPSIKLHVPDHLKALLVDDWENVTKNNQLVPIPHPQPVTKILKEYLESERAKRAPGSAAVDILEETIAGLREYFDKGLGRILLYR